MAVVFDRPSLWQRVLPVFQGFDWPLLGIVFFMAALGLVTMYSVGFDHGTRFAAHSRNMLLAVGLMNAIMHNIAVKRLGQRITLTVVHRSLQLGTGAGIYNPGIKQRQQ